MLLRQISNVLLRRNPFANCLATKFGGNQQTSAPFNANNSLTTNSLRLASSDSSKPSSNPPVVAATATATSPPTDQPPTIQPLSELLAKWRERFESEEVPEIESTFRNILAHVLRLKRLPADVNACAHEMTAQQIERFEELCECRSARMPIQYIIGEWDFRDMTLQMRPPVFIPRPETEELVELVLQQFDAKKPIRLLEVGCGSGAISLALLKALPKAHGMAIDQSDAACELTLSNAQRHQLDDRLTVRMEQLTRETVDTVGLDGGDGVAAVPLDLIVSNPPYVPAKMLKGLQPEVKIYEDARALVGGPTGMDIIESILWLASKRLRPITGVLWLEVDSSHPAMIQKYLAEHAVELKLKFVASYQDFGHKDRFVEIVREA